MRTLGIIWTLPVVIVLFGCSWTVEASMSFIVCFGATNEETPWVRLSCTASNVLQVVRATSGMRAGSACVPNPSCQKLHEEDTDRLRINCNQQASCGTPVGEASHPPCTGGTADYLVVEYECLTEVAYTLQPLGGVLSSARSPLLQLTTKSHPASAMTVFRDVCRVRFYGTQSASLDFLDLSPAGTSGGEDTYCIYVGSHMVTCAERASLPSTVNIDPGSDLEVLLWFWASNYTEAQARFWLRLTAMGSNAAELSAECGMSTAAQSGLATPQPYWLATESPPQVPGEGLSLVLILGCVFGVVVLLGIVAVVVFALVFKRPTKTTTRIIDDDTGTRDAGTQDTGTQDTGTQNTGTQFNYARNSAYATGFDQPEEQAL